MLVIPYYACLCLCFKGLKRWTNDETLSLYSIILFINLSFIHAMNYYQVTVSLTNHFITLLLAYYIFDIEYQIQTDQRYKVTYVLHHIVTILLIMTHVYNILPLTVGVKYLTLFEYSNTFLSLFQLCHKKHWIVARNIFAFPFVFTYVPLRLIAIPWQSLEYLPAVLSHCNVFVKLYCLCLLSYINVFSMYFAVIVTKKFLSHYRV
jgi:hypothetical protein